MKTIRESVFETNSSSTHSVCIRGKDKKIELKDFYHELRSYIQGDNYLHVSFGEFGWGPDYYSEPINKLSYVLTMIAQLNNLSGWYTDFTDDYLREEIEKTVEFQEVDNFIKNIYNCAGIYIDSFSGYIDHQSYEDYRTLKDFFDDYGTTLEEFIFNPYVELIIDNDNH